MPTGVLHFPSSAPGVLYHHWKAAVTPTSSIAHKGMVAGTKALAASVLDLVTSSDLLARARAQFADDTGETKYFCLLPADASGPVGLTALARRRSIGPFLDSSALGPRCGGARRRS